MKYEWHQVSDHLDECKKIFFLKRILSIFNIHVQKEGRRSKETYNGVYI